MSKKQTNKQTKNNSMITFAGSKPRFLNKTFFFFQRLSLPKVVNIYKWFHLLLRIDPAKILSEII